MIAAAAPMPRCTAPPWATACAWPTPSLVIEVETTDLHAGYGEEVKFGGGKTIRDGMGQSQRVNGPASTRPATASSPTR